VLILALPRNWSDGGSAPTAPQSSLDCFLKKRDGRQVVDLLFLYDGEDAASVRLEKSAEACVRFYGGKGGVRARHIRL
jgi:hypothetical protein